MTVASKFEVFTNSSPCGPAVFSHCGGDRLWRDPRACRVHPLFYYLIDTFDLRLKSTKPSATSSIPAIWASDGSE